MTMKWATQLAWSTYSENYNIKKGRLYTGLFAFYFIST